MAMGTVAVPEAARPGGCGDAGEGGGGEGDGAVEGRRWRWRFGWRAECRGADGVRGAGRSPGVEGLIEGDRAAGHGVAVHVEKAEGDGRRGGGGGEALGCAGDGLKEGVLGARAEGGVGDALAGSVEAGVDGGGLAFGERADGEGPGGDAGGVGEGRRGAEVRRCRCRRSAR